jgi:hypothetical protein
VLAWHDEDPRARSSVTLLLACKHLREQVALAEQFMSRTDLAGMVTALSETRGLTQLDRPFS